MNKRDIYTLYPKKDWYEGNGAVLWWAISNTGAIQEPPYCGCPFDADFPDCDNLYWSYLPYWSEMIRPQSVYYDQE